MTIQWQDDLAHEGYVITCDHCGDQEYLTSDDEDAARSEAEVDLGWNLGKPDSAVFNGGREKYKVLYPDDRCPDCAA